MEKPKWLKTLRFWSRLTSIVMVIVFSFLIFIMIALLNNPSFSEYFQILAVGSIYLIGVLISFFREGLGGTIILILLSVIFGLSIVTMPFSIGYFILFLFLSVPGILNISSWYYHKEFEDNVS